MPDERRQRLSAKPIASMPRTVTPSPRRIDDCRLILDAVFGLTRDLRLAASAAERPAGVGTAALRALRQLVDRPPVSLTELAERTQTDVSSVSVVVSRLVPR